MSTFLSLDPFFALITFYVFGFLVSTSSPSCFRIQRIFATKLRSLWDKHIKQSFLMGVTRRRRSPHFFKIFMPLLHSQQLVQSCLKLFYLQWLSIFWFNFQFFVDLKLCFVFKIDPWCQIWCLWCLVWVFFVFIIDSYSCFQNCCYAGKRIFFFSWWNL